MHTSKSDLAGLKVYLLKRANNSLKNALAAHSNGNENDKNYHRANALAYLELYNYLIKKYEINRATAQK